MRNGQLKPNYNAHTSMENQYVTYISPRDITTLKLHLDEFEQAYGTQSSVVVADAGYGNDDNYKMLENKNRGLCEIQLFP